MADKIITDYTVLIRLACAVGKARQSENPIAIAEAEKDLELYEKKVLQSDEVLNSALCFKYGY